MKNKTFRLSLIVLLLAIVSLSVISGTLAKYVETVRVNDAARVAKFEYTATANGTELEDGATINLFNTVNDDEVYAKGAANQNTEKLVAPGTYGHFDVVATNKSEVAIDVAYNLTETNTGSIPIVYFIKNGNTTTYYSNIVNSTTAVAVGEDIADYLGLQASENVTISGNLTTMATAIGASLDATNNTNTTTATSTIGWFWAFGDATNNRDTADTTLGKAGTATVSVNIGVTFTQAD